MQQKQIVVTCNYEARRRGLHKLQLIKEAKRLCPDVVIVLGEDLTRFRNASKDLYAFLKAFSWNSKVERLGFDEVFMDVSDIVDYNVALLNHDVVHSFFCLSKEDPTLGFEFDASQMAGHTHPKIPNSTDYSPDQYQLQLRLLLASHLARHLRTLLETEKGYTCTVGISTNKVLSKLVGNVHKPNDQTTLLPPYESSESCDIDNVTTFMDEHEVGKIPGIGFKLARKLRAHVLGRPPNFDDGLVYGGTKEAISVSDIRKHAGMSAEQLERILGGPGVPHGIGTKIWGLLNGDDPTEVGLVREVPKQISIEDSYLRLDTLNELTKELGQLAISLIRRMHTDLLDDEDEEGDDSKDTTATPDHTSVQKAISKRRWLAYPRTLRLSTRPRPPKNPDGSRNRSFARISRSAPMPNFVFNLQEGVEALSHRLVSDALLPLFRKLHPEKGGWDLSLVNVAATNMVDAASDTKKGAMGRNIATMFKNQDEVLKQWRVEDEPTPPDMLEQVKPLEKVGKDIQNPSMKLVEENVEESDTMSDGWQSDEDELDNEDNFHCDECNATMPLFALEAHRNWHSQSED